MYKINVNKYKYDMNDDWFSFPFPQELTVLLEWLHKLSFY